MFFEMNCQRTGSLINGVHYKTSYALRIHLDTFILLITSINNKRLRLKSMQTSMIEVKIKTYYV